MSEDHDRFARVGPARETSEAYLRATYGLDDERLVRGYVRSEPLGQGLGPALAQSSPRSRRPSSEGLGFVVLKTVIAQDAAGAQAMAAWAIKESRMVAEPITSREPARGAGRSPGGAGMVAIVRRLPRARPRGSRAGPRRGMLVVPSVKYHLPGSRRDTLAGRGISAYDRCSRSTPGSKGASPLPLILEKDFSPRSPAPTWPRRGATVLDWLQRVPGLIRTAAPGAVRLGLKLFNSLDDDDFQLAMLRRSTPRTGPTS